jgi:hypothetical protein
LVGSLGNMPANDFEVERFRLDGVELRLHLVGLELLAAREALAAQTELARAAAVDAAEAGVSERAIARALGVARSRTVRRWLGKT